MFSCQTQDKLSFLFVLFCFYFLASGHEPDLWVLQGPPTSATAAAYLILTPVCTGGILLEEFHLCQFQNFDAVMFIYPRHHYANLK